MKFASRSRRSAASLVAEPLGAYDTRHTGAGLAEVAAMLDDRDRQMGVLARRLLALTDDDGLPALLDGLSLQVWLEHHGRLAAADARRLLATVEVLRHLPRLAEALCDRWVSWSQTVLVCAAVRRVPVGRLPELDVLIAGAVVPLVHADPDALVWRVEQWAEALRPTRLEQAEAARDRSEFVALAPRLFGGGSLFGELGAVSFGIVAEALDAPVGPPVVVPDDLGDEAAVEEAFASLDDRRRRVARAHGAALAERLVGMCDAELSGRSSSVAGAAGAGAGAADAGECGADGGGCDGCGATSCRDGSQRRARPLVLATIDADALLDADRTPGWLLHTLVGGRMKVSAGLLQRLVDERGADVRGIVLDDCGQVVGVGRRSYVPPGWLREAVWARDTVVADPDRRTPVRRSDLDHVRPWPDGGTDVDNLQPLGRRWHNAKTSKRWTVTRARDGTTTWRHRRHGWRITLAAPTGPLDRPPDRSPPTLPLDVSTAQLARAGP